MSTSVPCVAHLCALPAEKKKLPELLRLETFAIQMYYISVRLKCLQDGRCSWPGTHSPRYQVYLIFSSYDLEEAVASEQQARFAVSIRPATDLGEGGAEQDVVATGGTKKDDESNRTESKNDGSGVGRTDSVEGPDFIATVARIAQDYFAVGFSISGHVNVCKDTIISDNKVL